MIATLLVSLFLTTLYFSVVILNEVDVRDRGKLMVTKKLRDMELTSHKNQEKNQEQKTEDIHDVQCDQEDSAEEKVVFIKIMKCASTAIANILMHFAYERDLEFVHPVADKIYIGWPYLPKSEYILKPVERSQFHISSHHVVYDRAFFESIMMPNTKYIASLREPYSQFKSMVNYFNVLNISGVPQSRNMNERFQHFVYNLEFYDTRYKSPNKTNRYCIPDDFSMTKNLMSFSLGFAHIGGFKLSEDVSDDNYPVLRSHDTLLERDAILKKFATRELKERMLYGGRVNSWLKKLDKEMDLILIVEWLPESLILLRRKFCWSIKDVLILNPSNRSYHFDGRDSHLKSIYHSWSWVDHNLYDHFNKSLWKNLDSQPTSFWSEVERFKEILLQVTEFCSTSRQDLKLIIDASEWNEEFEVQFTICSSTDKYIEMLKIRYSQKLKDQNFASSSERKLNTTFC